MKTQTAEEILKKNGFKILHVIKNIESLDGIKGNQADRLINAMHDHTTTQIEALRERLKQNECYTFSKDIQQTIDVVVDEFLKEINDGK
jgi:hypothetical protein